MAENYLSSAHAKLSTTRSFLIGTTEFTVRTSGRAYHNIVVGLTLWMGILSDYSNLLGPLVRGTETEARLNALRGRIITMAATEDLSALDFPLGEMLSELDDLADIQLGYLAKVWGFKGPILHNFCEDIAKWKKAVLVNPLLRVAASGTGEVKRHPAALWLGYVADLIILAFPAESETSAGRCTESIAMMRQLTCFLKKLELPRRDLLEDAYANFVKGEDRLRQFFDEIRDSSQDPTSEGNPYSFNVLTSAMKEILRESGLENDWLKILVPKHGNGAVAQPELKTWYDKYKGMSHEPRVAYLLDHAGLGAEQDYAPLVTAAGSSTSSRTSRFIAVPKTWKKLRGISAEPAELQYWQQGVLHSLDQALHRNRFWRLRVDIHDQETSRHYCLSGSESGRYSTIDLSDASDSVSLPLVTRVFGNSELARWLLGTRSVYTDVNGTVRRIMKFAPMGSAVCFPVECIIFALAAEVAVRRKRTSSAQRSLVRAYGDDIIVPTYAFEETKLILAALGFIVNPDKSFAYGGFRESCGAEGWWGVDVAPVRYKSIPIKGYSTRIDALTLASGIAMSNQCYARGFNQTRVFLNRLMLSTYFCLEDSGRTKVAGGKTKPAVKYPSKLALFATYTGAHSTWASPTPTNFHLRRKFRKDTHTMAWEILCWRKRKAVTLINEAFADEADACRLAEWLVRKQSSHEGRVDPNEPVHYECCAEEPLDGDVGVSSGELAEAIQLVAHLQGQDGDVKNRLSYETLGLLTTVALGYLKEAIREYQLADESQVILNPSLKSNGPERRLTERMGVDPTLAPTVKWVSPIWADAITAPNT